MIRRTNIVVFCAALALTASAGRAHDDGEIVWKTYSMVAYPGDGSLSCSGLAQEIGRIEADIAVMDKANARVQAIIHNSYDLHHYRKATSNGPATLNGTGGDPDFSKARDEIVKSRHFAVDRIAYLKQLQPQCKGAPARP